MIDRETMEKSLLIFTDGSSLGNPGPGGWGALLAFSKLDEVIELGGSKPETTNNAMELTAIVSALSYAINNTEPIHIFTDSQYAVNGITKWMYNWAHNGWVTKDGDEIKNKHTWKTIYELIQARDKDSITWHHVRGHIGVPGNERVDDIARELAEGENVELFRGKLSLYPHGDLMNITIDEEALEKRSNKNKKAYSYLSLVDGIVRRHATWAECEAVVKGKNAKFKKAVSAEHEQEILQEWGVEL